MTSARAASYRCSNIRNVTLKANWDKLKGKVIPDCFNVCPTEGAYHN